MNRLNKLFLAAVALIGLAACGTDHEDTLANWKWDVAAPADANPELLEAGWTNVSADYGTLPAYVNVYSINKTTDGKAAIAYIAVADMTQAKFSVSGDIHWSDAAQGNGNEKVYTPTEFYNNNGSPTVVINGGLFFESDGFYYSQSACYHGGVMLCPNQNYFSIDWTNFWYPTIGLFYQDKQGEFHTTWTYYANDGKDYSYASPRVEDPNKPDTEAPSATFPSAGTVLNDGTAVEGIGGVGVLVHGGEFVNTYANEMLDVSADSYQPRTAIGYNADKKKLFFFVCEGRQMTEGIAGMTTAQVGQLLKAAGCTEALNLDGGGSSCMLVNGKQTIKPSDGKERSVIDACFIK